MDFVRKYIFSSDCQITTAMLFAVAFAFLFAGGCLGNILMTASPADLALHDIYFIAAYQNYALCASGLMGLFAAIYYGFPKVFGRLMNEPLGKLHFALTFLASNWALFPNVFIGGALQPARYPTNYGWLSWLQGPNGWLSPLQVLYQFRSIGALVLGAAQIILLVNFCYSLFWGPDAVHLRERAS